MVPRECEIRHGSEILASLHLAKYHHFTCYYVSTQEMKTNQMQVQSSIFLKILVLLLG